jgi:predicted metal-dependent hydrolase
LNTDLQYTIRESPRARYARLKFSLQEGLVVVVPRGFDPAHVPELLRRNHRWLERAAQWVEAQRRCYQTAPPDALPEQLALQSIGQVWDIEYRDSASSKTRIIEHQGRLLVFCDPASVAAIQLSLKRWLAATATVQLKPWLVRLARQHGFEVHSVSIKAQRTRWASCSSRKVISLNLKLLFIPPELVEYTLLHELCHTVHLDHSAAFWATVQTHDRDCRAHDQQLKAAWQHVPPWLEAC